MWYVLFIVLCLSFEVGGVSREHILDLRALICEAIALFLTQQVSFEKLNTIETDFLVNYNDYKNQNYYFCLLFNCPVPIFPSN